MYLHTKYGNAVINNIKNNNKKKDKDRYKRLQREVQFKARRANRDYLETSVSGDYMENSKKFWTCVKSKDQEATGVAPFKNKDGFI